MNRAAYLTQHGERIGEFMSMSWAQLAELFNQRAVYTVNELENL